MRYKRVIMAVSSSGGHLSELMPSIPILDDFQTIYVTSKDDRSEDALNEKKNKHYIVDPNGSGFRYVVNFFQSVVLLIRYRPDIMISTGSGIAVFSLVMGWLMGSKIIYIESGARLNELSRTGLLIYKMADLFIVKTDTLHRKYGKSKRAKLL